MNEKAIKFFNFVTFACLYLVVFLIPFFFLPNTLEKIEINKYFLFYFLTLLALLSFLGKAVIKKGFEIRRTPLDLPFLILWFLFFVISLFSQDRYLSFFGNFNLLNLSFVGFSLMLVFYFLLIQHIVSVKQILRLFYTLLFSGFLTALYFILSSFSLIDWVSLGLPKFNLFSSSNIVFGFFISLISVLSLGFLAIKNKSKLVSILVFVVWILTAATLFFLGFKSIWVITAVGLFLLAIFFIGHLENSNPILNAFILFFLVISLLFIFLGQPKFLVKNLPSEVSLSPRLSWSIAYESLTSGPKNFIFGTGPGTFVFNFSQYRPDEMNLNFAWNIRFNQSYSTFFDWLPTYGILTTLSFLGVILMVFGFLITIWLRYIFRLKSQKRFFGEEVSEKQEYQIPTLFFWLFSCGWILVLISLFLINFGASYWILFWTLLGLVMCTSVYITKADFPVLVVSLKTTPQYSLITSFVFLILFTSLVVLGVYLGRFYKAETVYSQGLLQNNNDERIKIFSQALTYNNYRSQFYLGLADAYLRKAMEIASKGGSAENVSQALALAVNSAKRATEISPNNVAAWEFLASMYVNARIVLPEANTWVLKSLEKAIQLEDNNPLLYINLGDAKAVEKRFGEAKDDFEKALSLKPDLLLGYVRLAMLNEAQENMNAAVSSLERGLNYGVNNAEYLFYLGRFYFSRAEKGDYNLAELAFRKAIIINPNYSDALFSLAYLYEKQGLKNQANDLYKKVLELNPNNQELIKKVKEFGLPPLPAETTTSTISSSE